MEAAMSMQWRSVGVDGQPDSNKKDAGVVGLQHDMKSLVDSVWKHYNNVSESKNVMVYHEDKLFVWQSEDECVCCCRLKDSGQLTSMENVALTNPPKFYVDNLELSQTGRYLALCGSRGINVLELPRKWTLNGRSEGAKRFLLARSWCIAERFFVCNQRVSLLKCGWHPACQQEKHIVLLTSDNCLRIYDISNEHSPLQTIQLSSEQVGDSISSMFFVQSLGENAVDFDFGPPISKNSNTDPATVTTREECLWPMFVLRGNGDILLVYSSLVYSYVSKCIIGPLTMMPSAEDNYGVDACSILCLDCVPPVLVIATSSGIVHHCIALNTDESNGNDGSLLPQPTLFVYESVELLLSLISSDQEQDACPVKLHRDMTTPMRYFCSHSSGIYAIAVPFISQIKSKDGFEFRDEESVVEHLVCTKTIPNEKIKKVTPVGVNVGVLHGFVCLFVLLNTGEIILKRLSTSFMTRSLDTDEKKEDSRFALNMPQVDFIEHINQILKRNTSAPLLKSNVTETDPQKSLQILLTTIDILKKEYIKKFELASLAIERRAKALKRDKQIQMEELERCSKEKENLILSMEKFADKYDDTLKKQEAITNRIDHIMETLHLQLPGLSEAEIALRDNLKKLKNSTVSHKNKLEQIRIKHKYQLDQQNKNPQLNTPKNRNKSLEAILNMPSNNQISNIKETLTVQSEAISELLKALGTLKRD